MKSMILLLGSPNDENGKLSQIALERIECAYNIYASNENIILLCTGGFGEHFNTTNRPHAYYAKEALLKKGVRNEDFLPAVISSNTFEDFEKSKPAIYNESPDLLIVVTSDFHMERARILQKKIIGYPNIIFFSAKSNLSEAELFPLIAHEKDAVKRLMRVQH